LPGGATLSKELFIKLEKPHNPTAQNDNNLANNKASIALGVPDLTVDWILVQKAGLIPIITLRVANHWLGAATSGQRVRLFRRTADEAAADDPPTPFHTLNHTSSIPAGGYVDLTHVWSTNPPTELTELIATVEPINSADEEELDSENNDNSAWVEMSDPLGACCRADGGCSSTRQSSCTMPGHTFARGETCGLQFCSGACCRADGNCTEMATELACYTAGGVDYRGQATDCQPTPECPTLQGACCRWDGGCSVVDDIAACVAWGGAFAGHGTTCDTKFCGIVDLGASGDIDGGIVRPTTRVWGSFTVQNVGEPGSKLDWYVSSAPSWGGIWNFQPLSGVDLTPEDGPLTVTVSFHAPFDGSYQGAIEVTNSEDVGDVEIVPIQVVTDSSVKAVPALTKWGLALLVLVLIVAQIYLVFRMRR
jgi:hypothetical protein